MSANASTCDHRLSRAAVHILREHLRPVLELQPRSSGEERREEAPSLWSLLQAANASLAGSSCPLLGAGPAANASDDRAEWLDAERVARAVPASSVVATARRSSGRLALPHEVFLQSGRNNRHPTGGGRPPHFYRCALCGKVFTTRYYLDRHLDGRHRLHDEKFLQKYVCAADWCRHFLSVERCRDAALVLEPYYGPGSGEHGSGKIPAAGGAGGFGGSAVARHRWFRRAHGAPCRDDVMARTRLRCEAAARGCFSGNPLASQHLERDLCGTLSCHHRLHRLLQLVGAGGGGGGGDYGAPRHHHGRRGVGAIGVVVLVLLLAGYSACWVRNLNKTRRRVSRSHGSSSLPSRRRSGAASPQRKSSLNLRRSATDSKKSR
jgi:hypothetical protein